MFVWLILAAKCWLSISLKASNQRGLHESLHWVGDRLEARALGLLVESPKRTGRASGKDSALYDSAEYHHSIYLHTMMMMKIWKYEYVSSCLPVADITMVILNISLAPSQKMLRFHPPAALLRRRSRHVYVSEAPPRSATLLKVFLNPCKKPPPAKVLSLRRV